MTFEQHFAGSCQTSRSFGHFATRLLLLGALVGLGCQPKPAPAGGGAQASAASHHQAALARDRFALTPTTAPAIDMMEAAEIEPGEHLTPEAMAARVPPTTPTPEMLAAAAKVHTITLKRAFIDAYRDRATISTTFHVHSYVPKEMDGDIHIGGYCDDVIITGVAEIVNGYEHQDLLNTIEAHKGSTIDLTGVCRLWCEHPAPDHSDIQDNPNPPPQPNSGTFYHVFEIHPLIRLGSTDLSSSFHPIDLQYKSAHDADQCFQAYNNTTCSVSASGDTITIKTKEIGFNYPVFSLELEEPLQSMTDGSVAAMGKAFDDSGNQVGECRMIFVKGTPPYSVAPTLSQGQRKRVMGLVRMDLGVIEARADAGTRSSANLPYEMIILGFYP